MNTSQLLFGRIALVTGAGRGIGQTMALALAEAGARVGVMARSSSEVAETAEAINSAGGNAVGVVGDVSDRTCVDRCVDQIMSCFGPIDLLVNNAGTYGQNTALWETDPDDWWRTIEVNLRGPLLLCRAILPSMIERKAGTIINVGSYAGTHADTVPSGSYTTSKAALIRFSDSLAAATNEHNVRVYTISPGLVHTAMTDSSDLFSSVPESEWSPIEAASILVISLAATPGTALNGKFIHVEDDLTEMLRQADRIRDEELYTLRMIKLPGPA